MNAWGGLALSESMVFSTSSMSTSDILRRGLGVLASSGVARSAPSLKSLSCSVNSICFVRSSVIELLARPPAHC